MVSIQRPVFPKSLFRYLPWLRNLSGDTLTERITDNLMELANDGRWLGGNTPIGFATHRVTTGSGKGKSAYSYLESIPEEKLMVQRLDELFL